VAGPDVIDGNEEETRFDVAEAAVDALSSGTALGFQPAVVEGFGNEAGDSGMETPRRFEEETTISKDGRSPIEDVFERGRACPIWMRSLRNLRELIGVAEKHDRICGPTHGDYVGKGHLPCFIDEENIKL